jgi:hypothetical protein
MDWLISTAWAQAAGAAQPNGLVTTLPLVLIFVVFLPADPSAGQARKGTQGDGRGTRRRG